MHSKQRIFAARALAVLADATQLAFIPLFAEGAASPINDVVDVVVGIAMVVLVGWHWAFAPAFLAELVPFADLAPTWTLAVMIATRKGATAPAEAVVSEPAGSTGTPSRAALPSPPPTAGPGTPGT